MTTATETRNPLADTAEALRFTAKRLLDATANVLGLVNVERQPDLARIATDAAVDAGVTIASLNSAAVALELQDRTTARRELRAARDRLMKLQARADDGRLGGEATGKLLSAFTTLERRARRADEGTTRLIEALDR